MFRTCGENDRGRCSNESMEYGNEWTLTPPNEYHDLAIRMYLQQVNARLQVGDNRVILQDVVCRLLDHGGNRRSDDEHSVACQHQTFKL